MMNELPLVPIPRELRSGERRLTIGPAVDVVAVAPARGAASYLGRLLEEGAGVTVRYIFPDSPKVEVAASSSGSSGAIARIRFTLAPSGPGEPLGSEGYRLSVAAGEIVAESSGSPGFFWAVQTLRQLLPQAIEVPGGASGTPLSLPELSVLDRPRFAWRGLHLDVSRHFFPVAFVKKLIDLLAFYKLNVFHWHLTDDQGWRIEIKRYPVLTEVGAWRRGPSGERYGGFYTQEQIREVVAYAREREVTVVPEIEMPGHARAAIASLPWLSCTKEAIDVWDRFGISKELMCAGREETFEFLGNVLDEVSELFPSELVHIGGDECPKDHWKVCPDCQARIRTEGLRDEEALQGYFVKRIQGHLAKLGKKLVGWDEILEGGLAPGGTVMSWRGVDGGVAAAKAGHRAVMTPTSHCYFDYRQSANPGELGPTHFKPPVTTLRKVYSYEPLPEGLSEQEQANVVGAQANVWTEDMDTAERTSYMIFPRLSALAEVLWSDPSERDWESFKRRLGANIRRLGQLSIEYCRTLESLE